MQRKELIVIFVLAFLVLLAATMRLFSIPPPSSAARLKSGAAKRGAPERMTGGQASDVTLWPRPEERCLPRDAALRRLFEAAEAVAAEGLFDAAAQVYAHLLARLPADEPPAEFCLLRASQCYTLGKRHAEAAKHYEAFLARYPASDFRPMALLWSADAHVRLGDLKLARARLDEILAKYATSPFAEGARARLLALAAKGKEPPTPSPSPKAP